MKSILIVDDEASMREVLLRLLARSGWDAVAVGGGAEALEAFSAGRFGAAILDVDLGPGPSGLDVAAKLRRTEPGLKIVLMSGDYDNERAVETAGLGPMLRKPLNFAEAMALLGADREE